MSKIKDEIKKILDMRLGREDFEGKGHLQMIQRRIELLTTIRSSVIGLRNHMDKVDTQIKEQSGDFFKLLYSDPVAMGIYSQLDCVTTLAHIDEALSMYQKLEKRFQRPSVRIAFIGHERQGKSTFLQSMTGLPNEVIPAYDGTSCTGAISVIQNKETDTPFQAEIDFYTVPEFLENVKSKLKTLFPGSHFLLNTLNDLDLIDLTGYQKGDGLEVIKLIKRSIINHKNCYAPFLGIGHQIYTDKDEVMKFVAQYREYLSRNEIPSDADPEDIVEREKQLKDGTKVPVWRHLYYRYLAVKSVKIYCPFPNSDCKDIEFMDTIGLGASVNADTIEREMSRVLREDCDGAIDVFCPSSTGGSLPGSEKQIIRKLEENLSTRDPKKWLSFAINTIQEGSKCNTMNIKDILDDLSLLSTPFGFYTPVDAANTKEVNDKLLVPHLRMIAENLPSIDVNLIKSADAKAIEAFDSAQSLMIQARKVVPMQAITDWNFENDGFLPLNRAFAKAINAIDHDGYAQAKNKPCLPLTNAYEKLLDNIDVNLPSKKTLADRFSSGHLITCGGMFEEVIEEMRNGIFAVFENVNIEVLHPLQEKVKKDLIGLLYKEGRWSMLPLPVEKRSEEATPEWLENIMLAYVPQEKYPSLYAALRFILDYQINIEGLVEYNVTNSLRIIERTHPDFIPYRGGEPDSFEEKGKTVWKELVARIPLLQDELRSWIYSFALIPSHSFYSRVHKFHIKIGTDVEGVSDFKRFYNDNMGFFWQQEIQAKAHENATFGEWSEVVETLRRTLDSSIFKSNQ